MNRESIKKSIIYQDDQFLYANKPATISAQKDDHSDVSFLEELEKYSNRKLWVVHRIDRPTSGIITYAKHKAAARYYGKLLAENKIEKYYWAAVEGNLSEENGTLEHYLIHDGKHKKSRIVSKENKEGKRASLEYTTIAKLDHYTIIEIKLNTGRFHQIRAQFSDIGHPIKGDVKYGARRKNKDRSIHLHARRMVIPEMKSNTRHTLEAKTSDDVIWKVTHEIHQSTNKNSYEIWNPEPM